MKSILLAVSALFMLGLSAADAQSPAILRPPGGLALDSGTKTAAAIAGAATLNKFSGVVTTEALTTASGAFYTLTLTNSSVAAADQAFASVTFGTSTQGAPVVTRITPGAGSLVILVRNVDASLPFNGTLKVSYFVLKN